ncbi:MAG: hypothetical protein LBD89_00210 [Tannerellaceae bacterium]|jgi:hypothetical protein|nr:hypothetical protein [Tannerellaceae bacterium]
MTELILKTDIDARKMDVLLGLLKTWNIEVEVKPFQPIGFAPGNSGDEFPLTFGLWENRDIDARELRLKAWGIDKRLTPDNP